MDRTFDRLPQPDPRNYPVRPLLLAAQTLTPRSYTWSLAPRLDQGQEGACVGFAFAHELAARPIVVEKVDAGTARQIYRDAQKVDEWPGEDYEGTSVLAGAKVLTARGHFSEYRWATDVEDLALAIGHHGPAVLGIDWREDMFDPDADGTLHVTGKVVGGHAIIARGVTVSTRYVRTTRTNRRFRLTNSWGASWGVNGDAFVSFDDMEKLLSENGEACIPVRHRV